MILLSSCAFYTFLFFFFFFFLNYFFFFYLFTSFWLFCSACLHLGVSTCLSRIRIAPVGAGAFGHLNYEVTRDQRIATGVGTRRDAQLLFLLLLMRHIRKFAGK
jgi:hypothetical protein